MYYYFEGVNQQIKLQPWLWDTVCVDILPLYPVNWEIYRSYLWLGESMGIWLSWISYYQEHKSLSHFCTNNRWIPPRTLLGCIAMRVVQFPSRGWLRLRRCLLRNKVSTMPIVVIFYLCHLYLQSLSFDQGILCSIYLLNPQDGSCPIWVTCKIKPVWSVKLE